MQKLLQQNQSDTNPIQTTDSARAIPEKTPAHPDYFGSNANSPAFGECSGGVTYKMRFSGGLPKIDQLSKFVIG
jgi:hypothetical protein